MNAVLFSKSRIGLAVTLAAGLCASVGLAETESPYATGGEVTKVDLGNCRVRYIHVFKNTDEAVTFKSTGLRDLSLRYLVVGGGGGGGNSSAFSQWNYSGGGGGGGVCEKKDVPFAADAAWTVLVGRGATKAWSATEPGTVAGASSISNGTENVETVPGGGNGASGATSYKNCAVATDGAAGGGASGASNEAQPRKTSVPGDGTYVSSIFGVSPAGAPFSGGPWGAGYLGTGGGGASATGGVSVAKTSTTPGRGGNGGEGLVSDITGENLVYGSGGGAGGNVYPSRNAVGGMGGTRAGDGGTFEILDGGATTNFYAATVPAANSGCGGGGGGALASGYCTASDGADGIVVIRYEVAESPCEGGDVVKRMQVRGTRYTYIHIFTNTAAAAEFRNLMDCELNLRYLVVGGGGGGSNGSGGGASGAGGGGGGVLEVRGYRFRGGAQFSVEVGKGALAVEAGVGSEAGSSYVRAGETVIASAMGGGNAGFYSTTASKCTPPTSGANGGGGARSNADGAMGLFESSINGVKYGPFKGGDFWSYVRVGGSGAGARENGKTANNKSTVAPTGGEGLASDITGEELIYGSGGGVGEAFFQLSSAFPGCQGSDGGPRAGNGTKHDFTFTENDDGTITTNFNYIAATVPAANSGGGGGGGGITGTGTLHPSSFDKFRKGTGGADGIVVFRYDDPTPPGLILLFK